ncbi:magnesium/cobalt transporter CorA [bacterium]|nr:magnesium/cobalt transporter CorA [bacterium]
MPTTMMLLRYDADQLEERELSAPEEFISALSQPGVLWLHVQGEVAPEQLRRFADLLHLHPLAVEDVANEPQRPKAEEYEEQDFIIAHTIEALDHQFVFRKFSMFVGENYVLSFQTGPDAVAEPVRQRLRTARGLIRHHGVDHLMYALLDTIVDSYFPILEDMGEYLDEVQEQALWHDRGDTVQTIQGAKRELRQVRRVLWPLRDVLNVLMRDDNNTVSQPVRHFLRDCYDHVIQLMDMVEVYREVAADLMDAYLSAISNRMNSIMKVLTIIATLFMPLTFLVGLYGMNFRTDVSRWNMPELTWRYGYPFVWVVMVLCVIVMLAYFRRRGWIGRPDVPCVEDEEPCPTPPRRRHRDRVDMI